MRKRRASRHGAGPGAIGRPQRELQTTATRITSFLGIAQAFQASLSTVPMLTLAELFVHYLILGIRRGYRAGPGDLQPGSAA